MASLVRDQGVEVSAAALGTDSYGEALASPADAYFLILGEQGLLRVGEVTGRVRASLGAAKRLVLCAPLPIDRPVLLDMGADEIITPASSAATYVAERVLSQLILDKLVLPYSCGSLYGATARMREMYRHIETLAPLDDPLLILGETGTGKGVVAREVHARGGRRDAYVAVNCAELNPELLGSELFGHEKGAFTNAIQTRKGLIAEAGRGTVFLDEIGDLDLQAQAKLLHVLEERKIRRVGGNHWEEVSARFLLATNRNLEEDCQTGRFRSDLFERIRGFTLDLPPLRERKADIPLLVEHFVTSYGEEYGRSLGVASGTLDCLFRYDWPGNVRELRSAVRKAATYTDADGNISSLLLQEATRGRRVVTLKNAVEFDPNTDTWRDVQKSAQVAYFTAVLAAAKGDKDVAMKLSGMRKTQFYEILKENKII
ncbi:MAG TPA: sigma 54-interacting transcriptional regulator [Pyrinomonadaceae bacterium]